MTLKIGAVLIFALLQVCGTLGREIEHRVDLGQWVAKVPQGQERAKRLAEEFNLNFLGQVVPETNLFHFSSKKHHREKREIHKSLLNHTGQHFEKPNTFYIEKFRNKMLK